MIDRDWEQHRENLLNFKKNLLARPERNTMEDYAKEGGPLVSLLMDAVAVDTVLNLLHVQLEVRQPENPAE